MRDQIIIGLVKNAMENQRRVVESRMMMYERLIKEITEQLGGYILLVNSIPIIGILLRRLVEKYIRRYQKMIQREAIKVYQAQKKERKKSK